MSVETFEELVARNRAAPLDHKPDGSGLDDGPYLPGCAPRKKIDPKPAKEMADIRARAWATRRSRYGKWGHR
jgi:hypothetical protein